MNIIINSDKALYDHIDYIREAYKKDKYLRITVKTGKQRTTTQNAALHKYCDIVAQELNNEGLTFEKFFKAGVEVPWTMEIVKDNVWRPVQVVITGEDSTTKPIVGDYSKIYEILNRKLSSWGIHVPWPSRENR